MSFSGPSPCRRVTSGLLRPEPGRGPGQPCAKRRSAARLQPAPRARPGRVRRRPPSRPAPPVARPCPLASLRGWHVPRPGSDRPHPMGRAGTGRGRTSRNGET